MEKGKKETGYKKEREELKNKDPEPEGDRERNKIAMGLRAETEEIEKSVTRLDKER